MAQQTINIGTYANKGDGDPIRVAFTKVNANFTDLYARVVVLEGGGVAVAQDIQGDIFAQDSSLAYSSATNTHYGSFVGALDGDVTGSVFADNSTLIIDGVAGTINSSVLVGNLPALDGSALTNLTIPTQSALDDGLGVATVTTSAVTGVTIGGTAGITLIGAALASIDIGGSTSGTVTIGSGTNTVDYPSGTTVDFTGATVTGLSNSYIKAAGHVDVSSPITASADLNVASVTSSATGKYDITFTTPLPNANYVVMLSVQTNASSNNYTVQYYNRSTTGFQVQKFLNGTLDGGASGNFSFVVIQF